MIADSIVDALYHKLYTQSNAPEDGRNYRPKHVEVIDIINKLLLLHLVGCLCISTLHLLEISVESHILPSTLQRRMYFNLISGRTNRNDGMRRGS